MKEQLDEFVKRKDIEILDLKDKVKIRKEISEQSNLFTVNGKEEFSKLKESVN